jgi:hypothetical protein
MRAGAAIIWRTIVQKLVHAISVAEAEYYAACDVTTILLWFPVGATLIQVDNQSAIRMAIATDSMSRTKHIAIKQMAVTAYCEQGDITVQYCPTDENPADHFTKPLASVKLAKHVSTIMGLSNHDQFGMSRPLEPKRD